MPAAITYAHRLTRELARLRHTEAVRWLRPDSKSQVAVRYENDRPVQIESVVISTQHSSNIDHATVRDLCVEKLIPSALPGNLLSPETQYLINPTGRFVYRWPGRRCGLDRAQNHRRHLWGSGPSWRRRLSGKDPTKVRSISCLHVPLGGEKYRRGGGWPDERNCRSLTQSGIPSQPACTWRPSARAGNPKQRLSKLSRRVFSFKPAQIIDQLALCRPIYKKTTLYGHFGKPDLPWEQTDRTEALIDALPQAVFQST